LRAEGIGKLIQLQKLFDLGNSHLQTSDENLIVKPSMARANRHHLPGYVWHITHRCHKREYLYKFHKDKRRWSHWLFEAKKRYGLDILNYTVTSNHIHLLAYDGQVNIIPDSIQLIAGRTGREYNRRKNRKGAFWEDRYHATAVESHTHLIGCLAYRSQYG
jgi:REP element-mobilizing transposase RayT